MKTKRKQRRSKKSTVDLEQMFEKEVGTQLLSERRALSTRNVNVDAPGHSPARTPTRMPNLGLREITTGLEEVKKSFESKLVQTVSIEVYESDEETIGHEERNPVVDLVAKQAEALLAAKQMLTQENRELERDNKCLSDQVTYLSEMIDACELQRLELLEQNSALKFENTVLSGTLSLSKAKDRREKFYAMTPQNLDDGSYSPSGSGAGAGEPEPMAMAPMQVLPALAPLERLWRGHAKPALLRLLSRHTQTSEADDCGHHNDDGDSSVAAAEAEEQPFQLTQVYKNCIKNALKNVNL